MNTDLGEFFDGALDTENFLVSHKTFCDITFWWCQHFHLEKLIEEAQQQQRGDVTKKIPFPLQMINREFEIKLTMRFPHVTPTDTHWLDIVSQNVSINLIKKEGSETGKSLDTIELFVGVCTTFSDVKCWKSFDFLQVVFG